MGNEQIERWYSMKEISEYLGITRDTALSWIEKRGMPGVKVGRTWKFKISEVDGRHYQRRIYRFDRKEGRA